MGLIGSFFLTVLAQIGIVGEVLLERHNRKDLATRDKSFVFVFDPRRQSSILNFFPSRWLMPSSNDSGPW
ncbi:unnamed protein product [Calypogeia fissa]